jgi:hypothetical protein
MRGTNNCIKGTDDAIGSQGGISQEQTGRI